MSKPRRPLLHPTYYPPESKLLWRAATFVSIFLIMVVVLAGAVQKGSATDMASDGLCKGVNKVLSTSAPSEGNVKLQFLGWYVAGSKVDDTRATVKRGDPVELRVRLTATSGISRFTIIEIRKDIVWWPDASFKSQSYPVTLSQGESKQLSVTFTPDVETGSFPWSCRQYFFKVSGIVVYDPTNPDTRERIFV